MHGAIVSFYAAMEVPQQRCRMWVRVYVAYQSALGIPGRILEHQLDSSFVDDYNFKVRYRANDINSKCHFKKALNPAHSPTIHANQMEKLFWLLQHAG